jgi:hypothetical protein
MSWIRSVSCFRPTRLRPLRQITPSSASRSLRALRPLIGIFAIGSTRRQSLEISPGEHKLRADA